MKSSQYSTQTVFQSLKDTLHSYLEAQYHVWDESLIRERHKLLESEGATFRTPFYEATPAYVGVPAGFEALKDISEPVRNALVACASVPHSPVFKNPFVHQAKAIELFLGESRELVIATGTGSGKTESFLLPLLASLADEGLTRPKTASAAGVRALLLYPMNALVNDQLARLRRLLGNTQISSIVSKGRDRPVRFGMYTSRTPYPGPKKSPPSDIKRLKAKFRHYSNVPTTTREKLVDAGMWPAKDMVVFESRGYTTGNDDIELITRHEMQAAPPDILVTNYSMLEYMLIRPVERDIFEHTRAWLQSDQKAFFTVVLDEAHMYRGAAGAEVALLLRRLQARLGVDRSRLRFILTSASLGEGSEAQQAVKTFAAELTGLGKHQPEFVLVTGKEDFPPDQTVGLAKHASALASFDKSLLELGKIEGREAKVVADLNQLLPALGAAPVAGATADSIRDSVFNSLWPLGPVGALSRAISGRPHSFSDLVAAVFPGVAQGDAALEALMALCNFARRTSDGRVLLPIRMHLFFRGLGGVYACINTACSERLDTVGGSMLLGRLYDEPQQRCGCGARVYELLTHRDCGAAYLKAYTRGTSDDFLWHEQGLLNGGPALTEIHLLVQAPTTQPANTSECWLHTPTGRLYPQLPAQHEPGAFLRVFRPIRLIPVDRRNILSFERECPVCLQRWRKGTTRIMDLVTKGDAPFAHLIKTQVHVQPTTKEESKEFPNGGRKSLLFSDGRQKAARLARDIPREVEQDVFRQLLVCAVNEVVLAGKPECKANAHLYAAFVHVLSRFNLMLFDSHDRRTLVGAVSQFRQNYGTDLAEALDDGWSPKQPYRYQAELLRQLGNRFYSLHSLTLAYPRPAKSSLNRLRVALSSVPEHELETVCCLWLQHALTEMAFDASIPPRVRCLADGRLRPVADWGLEDQTSIPPNRKLDKRLRGLELAFSRSDAVTIDKAFLSELCELHASKYFITPARLTIVSALTQEWVRCNRCTWLAPLALRGACPECGNADISKLNPADSDYLRARKRFWRDPVARIVAGLERPFTIDVREHTAQLGYLDYDDTSSTTEDYERCFKDILTAAGDEPIDVLSSTTTMEVGIDIGSLIAVGLRNVPPMRQNYQQRAGRAGRRGSAVSTVITYAQNGAHDSHYFRDPTEIIRGSPPPPVVDVNNSRIVVRHVHSALIQAFFHERMTQVPSTGDLFSALGRAVDFFNLNTPFSLSEFSTWLGSPKGLLSLQQIQSWLPPATDLVASGVANNFVHTLSGLSPAADDERTLLDYLFEQGLLPTYAFPRALCALQIERKGVSGSIDVEQRPQQALSIALSEYSPGRLVVVDKKTYRVGAVTANVLAVDRAAPLFASTRAITYVHCLNCGYTQLPDSSGAAPSTCPFCGSSNMSQVEVIQPEVVYPAGAREVDEFEDDPVYSYATSAQYPVPSAPDSFTWKAMGVNCRFVAAANQTLIMVNKGIDTDAGYSGFEICELCGHAPPPGETLISPHARNYLLPNFLPAPPTCNGAARRVYLGFQFRSDLLLLRIPILSPLIQQLGNSAARRPLENALTSLAEAIALAAAHQLDVDPRELGNGVRFINSDQGLVADIFIHDTAAGGAGYAHMAGASLEQVLGAAQQLLATCSCDSSCRKCLRHYGNRLIHTELDRFLALDILSYIQTGTLPPLPSNTDQQHALRPVRNIFELAGYDCASKADAPLIVSRGARSVKIGVYPAVLEETLCAHPLLSSGKVFSDFELERNLPGVFSVISGMLQ